MAILKAINHRRFSFSDLYDIDRYISDPEKADMFSVGGYGCPPETWVVCNKALKCQHHAKNKKQFRHFVLGFDDHDKATVQTAVSVGEDVCKYFAGYYAKFAVHTNTPHIHIHIIVGNTSYENGKQLDMLRAALVELKSYCTDVLLKHGCGGVRTWKWSVCNRRALETEDDLLEIPENLFLFSAEQTLYDGDRLPEVSLEPYGITTAVWDGYSVGATRRITPVQPVDTGNTDVSGVEEQEKTSYYVVEPDPQQGVAEAFYHMFDRFEDAIEFCGQMPGRQGQIRLITRPFIKK
ncbi:MAG: relaxase/mobilization nuclease domain-containing protein [Oscillospiraceae bacterium]|nr:relaxase/mobilization nuclease domain-containing protein [Oscillospiraceae bacterium]